MAQPDPLSKRDSVAFSIAMIVIGVLIFIPSGLCTGILGGGALIEMIVSPRNSGGIGILTMALGVGGPFVAGGIALIWYGIRQLRGRR